VRAFQRRCARAAALVIIVWTAIALGLRTPLEKELILYEKQGITVYKIKYLDFSDSLPVNYVFDEHKVSARTLRNYVLDYEGPYYCEDNDILYCYKLPTSGNTVIIYYWEPE
jgi:hypothetical protein